MAITPDTVVIMQGHLRAFASKPFQVVQQDKLKSAGLTSPDTDARFVLHTWDSVGGTISTPNLSLASPQRSPLHADVHAVLRQSALWPKLAAVSIENRSEARVMQPNQTKIYSACRTAEKRALAQQRRDSTLGQLHGLVAAHDLIGPLEGRDALVVKMRPDSFFHWRGGVNLSKVGAAVRGGARRGRTHAFLGLSSWAVHSVSDVCWATSLAGFRALVGALRRCWQVVMETGDVPCAVVEWPELSKGPVSVEPWSDLPVTPPQSPPSERAHARDARVNLLASFAQRYERFSRLSTFTSIWCIFSARYRGANSARVATGATRPRGRARCSSVGAERCLRSRGPR